MTDNDKQPVFYTPQQAVVITAHADDVDFGMAGMVARWVSEGAKVTYVICTDNSSGSNKPGDDLDELVRTRYREQREAAAIVGVTDVRFLNYRDGVLTPSLDLRRDLTRIIRELKPQIVVTLDPRTVIASGRGYINHPDHRAAGEAALYAIFPSAGSRPIFPELLAEGYEPHDVDTVYLTLSENPTLHVDISAFIAQKQEALRCHKSQIGEEAVEMVTKWNKEAGEAAGYAYAEVFDVIQLRDPASGED